MKSKKVTYTIPEELEEALTKLASSTGIKKSTIVKQGIELWIKYHTQKSENM